MSLLIRLLLLPRALLPLTFLAGLLAGSLCNALVTWTETGKNPFVLLTHCHECGGKRGFFGSLPIVSSLKKCPVCGEKPKKRFILLSVLSPALCALSALQFWGDSPARAVLTMLACLLFLMVAACDREIRQIPNRFLLALVAVGLGLFILDRSDSLSMIDRILGGALGFALFLAVSLLASKLSKREALGGGDVKLAGAAGLVLGWEKLVYGVLIAAIALTVWMLLLRIRRGRDRTREYPFAPFLTVGFIAVLLFGEPIISLYLGLFR